MDYANWVAAHSVGDPLLDSYHYIFFQAVEQIEKVSVGNDLAAAQERLAFLLMYANMHFEMEEAMIGQAGYGGLDQHRAIHQVFRERLMQLYEDFGDHPSAENAARTAKLAREWWTEHILQEDRKYAPCLEKQGG